MFLMKIHKFYNDFRFLYYKFFTLKNLKFGKNIHVFNFFFSYESEAGPPNICLLAKTINRKNIMSKELSLKEEVKRGGNLHHFCLYYLFIFIFVDELIKNAK